MTRSRTAFAVLSLTALFASQPAEARRHYHHHASFYVNHPHYGEHRHRTSYAHHIGHYAVNYAVHYEVRRAVRAALAPVDGRDPPGKPVDVAVSLAPSRRLESAPLERTEYSHAGPRLGLNFAPGETRVMVVDKDSLAYAAGIDPGDRIAKANGATIRTPDDFARAIDAAATTGALRLTVERNGKEYDASIPMNASAGR
jgi:membrane-associated protease RseP (regulator of RpoE activity)